MKGKLLFQETQRFRGKIAWIFTLIVVILLPIIILYNAYENWQDQDSIGIVLSIIFPIALFIIIDLIKLTTEIDEGGIYIKFFPFVKRRYITLDEVQEVYVRKYNPIFEYGGWGYRVRSRKIKL